MICSRLHAFIRSYYSFSIEPLWFMVQYRIGCAMKGISLNIKDGSSTRNVFPVMSRPEIADQSSS